MRRATLLLMLVLMAIGAAAPAADAPPPVVAYYLHREIRCVSCLLVEEMAQWAIEARYAEQVAAGQLVFQPVNIEAPGQEHFEQDFELEYLALVLAEYDDDQMVRWQNLERIWDLYETPADFDAYLPEIPPWKA